MDTGYVRLNVTLPKDLVELLNKAAGPRSRSRFIAESIRDHIRQKNKADLEKQLEEGAIYGEHYAEHFIPTIEVLKFIIERLEGLQNGN